jgi:6-phosphogluconolactonase/glucosamine-6-phosphate isomerase/deaminase
MKFLSLPLPDAISELAKSINDIFRSTDKLLLLLSGGSNIEVAVELRPLLRLTGKELSIGLIDERYGKVGHADSNWTQLVQAGFDFSGVTQLPVLVDGLTIEATATRYSEILAGVFDASIPVVGILGLGGDGHTAGILPASAALCAPGLVTSYSGPDYDRVTLTPPALQKLDQIFLVAYGKSKHEQLVALHSAGDVTVQPAQLLRRAKHVVIYNDLKGNL